MEQRALHETFSRLLWRFSMEHDGNKINWKSASQPKYNIWYSHQPSNPTKGWTVDSCFGGQSVGAVYFKSETAAYQAIAEIVEPFVEAHPEFVW